MGKVTGTGLLAAALVIITPFALTACGGAEAEPRFVVNTTGSSATPSPTIEPLTLAVTPALGAKKQPVSTEIGTSVTGGSITEVILTAANGTKVKGAMRDDGTSWVPASPLKYEQTYTANVTATGPTGQTATETTSFTTMGKPGSLIGSGLYLFDDKTYGVAMPVVVEFIPGIAKKDRAAVQKRMFVQTDPPQPGTWHWVENGTQAYYRAPEYWQPQTTIRVRIALEGIPLSGGRYGNTDRKATVKIGSKLEMKVDNATKQISVYENDVLTKTFPVSLGKKKTPSSSGTMVVMEKQAKTIFDTTGYETDPDNRYRTEVEYAQRLTWGGEYIHAAPWSVADQGHHNVSHGCVNMSTANAAWLFNRTKVGDPITVTGTEVELVPGNGWTAWNLSWAEFVKGSALPVPADLGGQADPSSIPSTASSPTATPTATPAG